MCSCNCFKFNMEKGIIKYPLHHAIYMLKDINEIKLLLDNGEDINKRAFHDFTPLHYAVSTNNTNIIKLLLDRGANVNEQDKEGHTPLYYYSIVNNVKLDVVKLLLDYGSDINIKTTLNETALHIYADTKLNNVDVMKLLLDKDICINDENINGLSALSFAVKNDNIDTIKLLLSKGADINIISKCGDTLLHYLNNYNHEINILKMSIFLQLGLDVNKQNHDGDTPLHLACRREPTVDLINLLLDNGANINIKNNNGSTPLHRYVLEHPYHTTIDVMKLLLDKGANPNIKNRSGNSSFNILCSNKATVDFIQIFLNKGADINIKGRFDYSPLYQCVSNASFDVVKLLLDNGANPNEKSISGRTAVHNSVMNKDIKIIKLIIENGGDINEQDDYGNTPLHFAVNNVECLKLLLDKGAILTYNKRNESILMKAAQYNNLSSVKLLLETQNLNVNDINSDKNTILDTCFVFKNIKMLELIIYYRPSFATTITTLNRFKERNDKMIQLCIIYCVLLNQDLYEYINCENNKFIMDCKIEIEYMKNTYIDYNLSVYDILYHNNERIAVKYVRNNKFNSFINFDKYGNMLHKLLEKSKFRNYLIHNNINKIDSIYNDNNVWNLIPYEIKYKILNYISIADLKIMHKNDI
nr:ankyrin repeat protein [Wadden Sea poxvirus]